MPNLRSVALLALVAAGIAWLFREQLAPLVEQARRQLDALMRRRTADSDSAQWELAEVAAREAASSGADVDGTGADTAGEGDDLKVIEGIGPRIEEVLKAAGITTYAKLAETRPGRLETVMKEAGTRLANPETWPEQAALAAAGDWEGLRELQGELKGGRRVG